jgi:hypothetical protein
MNTAKFIALQYFYLPLAERLAGFFFCLLCNLNAAKKRNEEISDCRAVLFSRWLRR